ncbi:MAG: hypothetical protein NC548_45795 [Lachnospiraceae bacterium]|nr:hypothetical protein [Lachnospiraceae bacterium]
MNRNIGFASLLTVLAVLCISIFAILTFTTAKMDERLSKISATSVGDYYNAEYEAQQIIANIRNGNIEKSENDEYTFTCEISDNRKLEVTAEIKGNDYRIIAWTEKGE